jgi:hypothetical protein
VATVDWKNVILSKDFTVSGFNFRQLIAPEIAFGPDFVGSSAQYSSIFHLTVPTEIWSMKTFLYGSFATDILRNVTGTVTGMARETPDAGVSNSVSGLMIDYATLRQVAETETREDDITLWAAAFSGDDFIFGGMGNDLLEGFSGADAFFGEEARDTISGGDGNDTITGGQGGDSLWGGGGADQFVYLAKRDSTNFTVGRDTIYDFSRGEKDKIDLRGIDANSKAKGNQAFKFIGTEKFHKKAGELRYEKKKGDIFVHADINGDGKADLAITLKNLAKITKGDFFL